jgi:ubiquinone/menaquinone biosynthesis C-methylase UbiE
VKGLDQSQFHRLANYYDAINDWKDYGAEAVRLEALARRYGRPGPTSWLDVACGTGRHLEFLRRHHEVVGLDASREMLRVARRRLPGTRLVRGDMRTFRLDRRFDVVTCLFSAIGHLKTGRDVGAAFENFARHLNPGGVAIVEPWVLRSAFRPPHIHLRTHQSRSLTIVRLSSSARRGRRSVIHFHFLIGEPGREIRYFHEEDVGLLLSREELVGRMRRAGLKARFLAHGFMRDRGLLIGVKPSMG